MKKVIHSEIKRVVEKFGLDILTDQRILYILSDYGAFDRLSDDHDIVKELQAEGYGNIILDYKNNNDAEWKTKVDDYINSFVDEHSNYKISDVVYICKAIAYGAGLLSEEAVLAPSSDSIIDIPTKLKKYQDDYISLLKSSIATKQGYYLKNPTVFIPTECLNKLDKIESKICMLGQDLGQDLSSWCTDIKQSLLDNYTASIATRRKIVLVSTISFLLLFVFATLHLISFLRAKDAIYTFNNEVQIADSLYNSENYLAALASYKNAGSNYQESYRKRKYHSITQVGIMKSTTSWIKKCLNNAQDLYDKEDYYEALLLLKSKPDDVDCSLNPILEKNWDVMEADLETKCNIAISSEIDDFIKTISNGKGNTSKQLLERVDYLLTIEPDNYWLLFIKNRTTK